MSKELARVLLDRVQYGKQELTLDASDMTAEQVKIVREEAAARGLHVSGTARWLLIRQSTEPLKGERP